MTWSWKAPRTWTEAISCIERGLEFNSIGLELEAKITTEGYVVTKKGVVLATHATNGEVVKNPNVPANLRFSVGRVFPALQMQERIKSTL